MIEDPKILLFDIESLPNVVTSWDLRIPSGFLSPENIIQERTIVCGAWKWLGRDGVYSASVLDSRGTEEFPDAGVCKKLAVAIGSADAVIAHNGDKFDMKWVNTRLVIAGLSPLPPVLQIDTLKIAKKHYNFNSNKLDYLGQILGVGGKIRTDYSLWKQCLKGDREAIKKMVVYNKEDVCLLERVYLKLRAKEPAKANRALWVNDEAEARETCPTCGHVPITRNGWHSTRTARYPRYHCPTCNAYSFRPANAKAPR